MDGQWNSSYTELKHGLVFKHVCRHKQLRTIYEFPVQIWIMHVRNNTDKHQTICRFFTLHRSASWEIRKNQQSVKPCPLLDTTSDLDEYRTFFCYFQCLSLRGKTLRQKHGDLLISCTLYQSVLFAYQQLFTRENCHGSVLLLMPPHDFTTFCFLFYNLNSKKSDTFMFNQFLCLCCRLQ